MSGHPHQSGEVWSLSVTPSSTGAMWRQISFLGYLGVGLEEGASLQGQGHPWSRERSFLNWEVRSLPPPFVFSETHCFPLALRVEDDATNS